MIPNYTRVRVIGDSYSRLGAPAGTIGFVIETYENNAYEVEVCDPQGMMLALFAADEQNLEVVE